MADGLYLGKMLDGDRPLSLDPDHLTTHAVCLGMTGSGKTGLGIVALEELARQRVPLLIIDLKGDMVNLLLNFPSLAPEAFQPWLPADEVAGRDPREVAAAQAELWRRGLDGSGLGSTEMAAVRDGLQWQLVTPGVSSLAPLDILPALAAPAGADSDPDGTRERVNHVVSSLLSLVGRGGDPLSDRDHVLLASTLLEHWRRGDSLTLVGLLTSLVDPPMDRLGAFPLDTFYPRAERMKLVFALNTLVASPAFAAWTEGLPLSMEALLGSPEAPRASIVSIAHLDTRQRLFVLGLLFGELGAWMRRQPASAGLRALLYVDEVQGILPPHPANPPTKGPLLTLLKQGRAFGVGAWLATQNPVDLDYKALGNAGVKLIGRLITDRDRERALEGLGVSQGTQGLDPDQLVAGLGKRQFMLLDVRASQRVQLFSSRWAMSYLRGPVTLAEMAPLTAATGTRPQPVAARSRSAAPAAAVHVASDGALSPPVLGATLIQRFDPHGAGECRPELRLRCRVTVARASLELLRTVEESWRIPVDPAGRLLYDEAETLHHDPALLDQPPPAMRFPAVAPAELDRELAAAPRQLVRWRARRPVVLLANSALKLVAAADESREAFLARCLERADRADDRQQEQARARFEKRIDTLRRRLEREQEELQRDQEQADARRTEEKLGVVEGLFSVLLGSRSVKSATGKAASRLRGAATKRRMRQRAESSVAESANEIQRLADEIEDLGDEMAAEVERIAAVSEAQAAAIDELPVRPKQADVELVSLELVWS